MDKHDENAITRREVVSLAGIAAALGVGLGIAEPAAAEQDPGMLMNKNRPGTMQLKFYSTPDASGKQVLLGTVPVPVMLQHKFERAVGGRVQLKLEMTSASALPAVQRPAILAESVLQFKQTSRAIRNPIRR